MMKNNGLIIALTVMMASVLISCGGKSATSKVKAINLTVAQKRDVAMAKLPVVSFDKSAFDFGRVKEGDIVKTSFLLTNTGKGDLVVTDAKSTCGCTIPIWPKTPIKPGKTAQIKVSFNTVGKPNKQSKSVTIYTNTKAGVAVVKLSGFVIPNKK